MLYINHYTLLSLAIFLASAFAVLSLQLTVGLTGTGHYFLGHFFFGLGFPFLFYSFFRSLRSGKDNCWNWVLARPALKRWLDRGVNATTSFYFSLGMMSLWHLENELWTDQLTRESFTLDVDHFIAGAIGLALAAVAYQALRRRYPDF